MDAVYFNRQEAARAKRRRRMFASVLWPALSIMQDRLLPAAEKRGIFWPLAMEFMTSIVEMPVWIISSG